MTRRSARRARRAKPCRSQLRAPIFGVLVLLCRLAGAAPEQTGVPARGGAAPPAVRATTQGAEVVVPPALPAALEATCDPRVQRHRLKNGVEVVLRPREGLPSVHVRASIHVGSRNDPPGYEGLAHYVEHLTFRPVPGFAPVSELYEEVGATGLNASTTLDTTDYYATVPSAQLERALWIEARRLALGVDLLAEEPALSERQVLQREHSLRYGTGVLLEERQALHSALFPSGHPYRKSFASQESQGRLSLSHARWFFARHYRPDRVRLVLAGDFDPAVALALAERWFGGLVAKANVAAASGDVPDACTWAKQPLAPAVRRVRVSTTSKNQRLTAYWPITGTEEPEQWHGLLDFLTQRLRDAGQETGLSAAVELDIVRGELGHFYQLTLPLAPAQPLERAEPLLAAVLQEVRHLAGEELRAAAHSIDEWTRTGNRSLQEQTRQLALRQCQPLACKQPTAQPAAGVLAQLQRFELGRALLVEHVHEPNAPSEGEVEVLQ